MGGAAPNWFVGSLVRSGNFARFPRQILGGKIGALFSRLRWMRDSRFHFIPPTPSPLPPLNVGLMLCLSFGMVRAGKASVGLSQLALRMN